VGFRVFLLAALVILGVVMVVVWAVSKRPRRSVAPVRSTTVESEGHEYVCARCGHHWSSETAPAVCPSCKSPV
jgi:hypothetical protein